MSRDRARKCFERGRFQRDVDRGQWDIGEGILRNADYSLFSILTKCQVGKSKNIVDYGAAMRKVSVPTTPSMDLISSITIFANSSTDLVFALLYAPKISSITSLSISSTIGMQVAFFALSDSDTMSSRSMRFNFHFLLPAKSCFRPDLSLSA
jgi:hypothetical protein